MAMHGWPRIFSLELRASRANASSIKASDSSWLENKLGAFLLSLAQKSDITLLGDIFMSQNRIIAIVLLVVGAIALYFGFNATSAPTEEISEALTGQYSDQTMLYLIGGAVSAVAGVVMLLRK
jgi:hypothetical protein